jgi:4-hydroxy-2-oxoheptanedioate aldolase
LRFENLLQAAWARGEPTFGAFAAIPSGVSAEIVADVGLDFVCIDLQHGFMGLDGAVPMIQAISGRGAAPVVRVPVGPYGYSLIEQVLDAGALGIIAPLVNTVSDAQRVVDACRFPPAGRRSFGPIRAGMLLGGWDLAELDKVVCCIQIESAEGLENVESIAGVEGLDAVYIGPSDLAISLGRDLTSFLDEEDPLGAEEIRRIKAACDANGVVLGTACGSGEAGRRYAEHGFQFLTITGDTSVLAAGMKASLIAARGDPEHSDDGGGT